MSHQYSNISQGAGKKRPYFATAAAVVAAFKADRSLTSYQIGNALGLHPAYVRKALSRNGKRLKRSTKRRRNHQGA